MISERYGGLSMENSKLNHTENQNTDTKNTTVSDTAVSNAADKAAKQSVVEKKRARRQSGQQDGAAAALAFVKEHVRYFAAGALLIVLVLVLALCAKPGTGGGIGQAVGSTEEAGAAEEAYQVDAYEDVNALISQYYTAYASGDLATLTSIATPVSANEQSYITLFGQYVDEYQNIKCYTKSGLDANSYLVSVSMEIKFTGVDTTAPGLDFFYIRTNDQGALYIDNLYSQYNLANQENALDTSVQSLIYEFENDTDVMELQSEIQERYDVALATDANLALMIQTTIPGAIKDWVAQIKEQNEQVQTENTEQIAGTGEAVDGEVNDDTTYVEDTETTPDDSETAQTEQLATTDRVNVRAGADTSSEKLGTVEKGTVVTRTGVEGDWSKIDYNGTTGYIKNEYLTYDVAGTASDTGEGDVSDAGDNAAANTDNGDTAALSEGTVVTLKDSVNVRSGMSEDADRIGTAYSGEKVTVVMSYAEGWTKVKWNGETGYIKTSLLQ